jgi:RNA polymerase sigma factor (sigma-70 family)
LNTDVGAVPGGGISLLAKDCAFGFCSRRLLSTERAMTEDPELLRHYLENQSEAAFSELVRRHLALVYGTALRRTNGDSHRAEDIAQLVFVRLAREAMKVARHPAIHGWLYVATRHAAAEVMRTEQRRKNREAKIHAMHHDEKVPTKEAWHDLRPDLDAVLEELEDRERDVVLLRFFDGRPFAEIGVALRISEDAARMRVDRALEKLRTILARRGVTSTTAALGVALAAQGAVTVPSGLAAAISSAVLSPVGLGGTAALTMFMTTSKTITGVASAVAILAISCAIYQTRAAREAEMSLAALQQERGATRRAAPESASNSRLEIAQKGESNLTASARPVVPAASIPIDYVLSDARARAAFVEHEILKIKNRYAPFFRSAKLSPPQQEQFLQLQKDATNLRLEFFAALRGQGFGPDNLPQDLSGYPELTKENPEWQKLGSALKALLGADGFTFYQQFERSVPRRNVLDQVTSTLFYTEAPLTRKMAGELMDGVLLKNQIQFQAPGAPTNTMGGISISADAYGGYRARVGDMFRGGSPLDLEAPVTDAAIAQAQTFLSPTQLAVLKDVQAQQLAKIQISRPTPVRISPLTGVGK